MRLERTHHGFPVVLHETYTGGQDGRLVQASSAIGDYPGAFESPGHSYLWIGKDHHLNREQVRELIVHMRRWLDTGRLS